MKPYLLALLSFSWFCGLGQKTLSGVVMNGLDSVGILGANVILKETRTGKTLGFTSTNEKGNFVISLPNNLDSVFLKVSNVGYTPFEQTISTYKGVITVPLFYTAVELREVVIKKSPIYELNDTLIYDVSSFKTQEDQVIGDLIARLPGIDVEQDGRIKFQGKEINKYYIEGLDLLEGRYSIANRNIKISDIKTIEVYQNHQPVRILDSLEFSDQAALNLVLKNNYTVVNTAEIEIGLKPLLGNLKTSNILFKPAMQLITALNANNIGIDLSGSSIDFTEPETFENQPPKLNILSPNTPSFDSRRWLMNEDVLGTFNSLNKFKNGFQIKTFVSYGRNNSKLTGISETAFFNNNEEIARLEEKRVASINSNQLTLEFIAERNNKKDYSKNKLSFTSETNSSVGFIGTPFSDLNQLLTAPKYSVRNKFEKYIKLKKQLFTIRADFSYFLDSQNLVITEDSTQSFRRNVLSQDLHSDIFLSQVHVGSKVRYKKFNVRYLIGNNINFQHATSSFFTDEEINLNINRVSLNQVNSYLQVQADREIHGYQFTLGSRLNTTNLIAKPSVMDEINKQTHFYLEPRITVSKRMNHFWSSDLNFQRNVKFGSVTEYFNQELLLNYREVQNGVEEFQTKLIHSATLTINYKDVVKNVFGGYSTTISAINQNLISETSITSDGQTLVGLKAFDNSNSNIRQDIRLSKFWRDSKTNLSVNAALINNSQEIFVNTVMNKFFTYTFMPSLTVSSQPMKAFKWVIEGQLLRSKISSEITGLHRNNQANLISKILYFPSDRVSLQLQNENYVTQFGNLKPLYNSFVNADMWLDLKGKISQVKLSLSNILNEREFNIIANQNLFTSVTNFNMRPFQVLGTVKFTL